MLAGPRRWGITALTIALAFALTACNPGREVDKHGLGLPDSHSSTKKKKPLAQRCPLDEDVVAPEPGTPEWVLYELYASATQVAEDEEAAFKRFAARFDKSKNVKWVRSTYWKAARKHLAVVVPEDAEPEEPMAITLCRREENDDTLKLWVKSHDVKKSHLPVTLTKGEDGGWKVTTYPP